MRYLLMLLLVAGTVMAAAIDGLPAVVQKDSVSVYSKPAFTAPTVATLGRRDSVKIAKQQGLWYEVALHSGVRGYLRVNEVRIADASATHSEDTMHILLTGKSGTGRATETAGVRGLDESDLRNASYDGAQLAQMESQRVSARAAARYAAQHGWSATRIAWRGEAAPSHGDVRQTDARKGASVASRLLGAFGHSRLGSMVDKSEKIIPKSDAEVRAEAAALGPLIAGRVLGARHLWANPHAQHRINVIGRWLASQTSQPDLPWTFGVIDSSEYNAYAAPGGYILVTRGLYQLVSNDQELAAVLGHEITHVVQRDHYEVIRKQGMMSAAKDIVSEQIHTGGGVAGSLARDYAEKNGASIMLTKLDRNAEYRADENAQLYLARAGMNPLALYSILQKMLAMGSASDGLASLYKTHPPLDDRLDDLDRRGYGKLQPYLRRPIADSG